MKNKLICKVCGREYYEFPEDTVKCEECHKPICPECASDSYSAYLPILCDTCRNKVSISCEGDKNV